MTPETFFAIPCLLAGSWYSWRGLALIREVKDSKDWPSVQGVILLSDQRRRLLGGAGRTGASHANSEIIRYRYEVGGKTYESEIVELGGRIRSTPKMVAELVQRFPEGARVPVWYRPGHPQTSCLLREGRGAWLWLAGGLMAVAGGLALLAGLLT